MSETQVLPSPCLVVLVGPVAAGKSTWAEVTFTRSQIVSSDSLRAAVGESEHDLAASQDAFAVLDDIVARRLRRRLTTVVDSLGLDADRRHRWRAMAERAGVAAVAVIFDTPAAECRRRNAAREFSVPADIVARQRRRWSNVLAEVADEMWHDVIMPEPLSLVPAALVGPTAPRALASRPDDQPADRRSVDHPAGDSGRGERISVGLHLSAFDWPGGRERFAEHLGRIVTEAEDAGIAEVWLMDHLRQIPQVGPAWGDIPDPYTTLAWIAARTQRLRLGVLVSPAFLRHPALVAKAVATVDVVSGGRMTCGLGVGWFAKEYAALGIAFPALDERYARLEDALRVLPLLWGKGAPAFVGRTVTVPEALAYPRPLQEHVPLLVGGGGERRTLRLAARYADACNLFGDPDTVARRVAVLRRHCAEAGRDPAEVAVTHLSTVLIGRDRSEVGDLVEQLRPRRRTADQFARDVNAGTVADHAARAERLAAAGVSTMMVSCPDIAEPGSMERLAAFVDRLR